MPHSELIRNDHLQSLQSDRDTFSGIVYTIILLFCKTHFIKRSSKPARFGSFSLDRVNTGGGIVRIANPIITNSFCKESRSQLEIYLSIDRLFHRDFHSTSPYSAIWGWSLSVAGSVGKPFLRLSLFITFSFIVSYRKESYHLLYIKWCFRQEQDIESEMSLKGK